MAWSRTPTSTAEPQTSKSEGLVFDRARSENALAGMKWLYGLHTVDRETATSNVVSTAQTVGRIREARAEEAAAKVAETLKQAAEHLSRALHLWENHAPNDRHCWPVIARLREALGDAPGAIEALQEAERLGLGRAVAEPRLDLQPADVALSVSPAPAAAGISAF